MKYGFLGCGNMGGALARALARKTTNILLTDRSGKGRHLAEELGCSYVSAEAVAACRRVFLGVKPQMMAGALKPLQPVLAEMKPLLITMAAGLTMEQIQQLAGCNLPVIRIMPNTPVAVGKGLVLYCRNELVTDEVMNQVLSDMEYAGIWDCVEEKLIDSAGTVTGCGPAYMYMFLEAMADGAVACGVPRAKAMAYAAAAMEGAAEMDLQSGKHPGQLKDEVCSPGGSTIAGVRALEDRGFRSAVMECVMAAYRRNLELGK